MICFKVLYHHLLGRAEKSMKPLRTFLNIHFMHPMANLTDSAVSSCSFSKEAGKDKYFFGFLTVFDLWFSMCFCKLEVTYNSFN